ncbi:pyridoxal phosphate-dependent aminotransferase [Hominifimenecus sp. rT4P-3]|uniref:pyridoxal phosphate-dependent aminotransferase n=1 Tax=Hominifimenecus sp. rT4P-3 TaxID=3242979 RepID=UPI003DA2222A
MKPWMKNVRQVEPYVPGEQPKAFDVTKLNTNENPYPPAPGVIEAFQSIQADALRRYPDPSCSILTEALAKFYHVGADQVFVGVGSDDVLAMAFQTFFNSEKPILFPDISYAFYPVWAELFGIPYEKQPLDEEFRLVKEDYCKPNGGIVFPNPNAPTSILEPVSFVEEIVSRNPESVVIVDEAYIDFGGESALPLVDRYDNLLIVQTFSKSRSLAGMRIGFCIGSPELIQALQSVKYSFNSYTMNEAALVLGAEALKDETYFRETLKKIVDTRAEAVKRLQTLGFTGPAPMGNFLFVTHEKIPARTLFTDLRKENIFVRYFDKPRIDNYLRITVGTPEEMERLYQFLENYSKEKR